VRRLDLDGLAREADAFDRAADATADVDQFCSSSGWILPAAVALMAPGEPVVLADGGGYAAFVCRTHDGARVLEPGELAWGLASPLVGPDVDALAELAAAALDVADADVAALAGLVEGSPLWRALLARLGDRRLGRGPATRRHLASLDGGLDGFLARRPRQLRKALRQAARRAAADGLAFEHAAPGPAEVAAVYARALAVDAATWKARVGTGLAAPEMRAHYGGVLARAAARGAARVTFARLDDRDVGYVLGARWGDLYRGLQFGFDDAHRARSIGNLAQREVVAALVAEGARRYDLGTGGDYKARWAEDVLDTAALVVGRRAGPSTSRRRPDRTRT
jgi:hypothetical protein